MELVRNRDDAQQTAKGRHPLRTGLIVLTAGLLLPLLVFLYALREHAWRGYLSSAKMNAKATYQTLSSFADFSSLADIPAQGEVYLTGSCRAGEWYLADAGTLLPEDTVLYGEPDGTSRTFFAVRLTDGAVTDAWIGNYPFTADGLKPVTVQEQYHPVPLFLPFSESDAVGYYHPE